VGSSKQVDYPISIGTVPVTTWRKRVALGMITEATPKDKDKRGATDAVWSSATKLAEMKTLYEQVKKKYPDCYFITVIVK
jgi:hypothetical protein